MKRELIFVVCLIFLMSNICANGASAGPLLQFKYGKKYQCETNPSDCIEPLSDTVKQYIDDNFAKDTDLIAAAWYEDHNPSFTSLTYFNDVYKYIKSINPDMVILEYSNPYNYAADIFAPLDPRITEDMYLHYPFDPPGNNKNDGYYRLLSGYHYGTCPFPPDQSLWMPYTGYPYNEFAYDLRNPEWINFFKTRLVEVLKDNPDLDGVYFDNTGISKNLHYFDRINYVNPPPSCDGTTFVGWVLPTDRSTGIPYTLAGQQNASKEALENIMEAVNDAKDSGEITQDLHIFFNSGDMVVNEGVANEFDLASTVGGVLTENGWFAPTGEGWINQVYGSYTWPLNIWKDHVDSLKKLMENKDEAIIFLVRMRYDTTLDSDSYPSDTDWVGYPESKLLFSYASALLGAGREGDKTYLRYEDKSYNELPIFDLDIGYATGDYAEWPSKISLYYRYFDKALVLVNPTDKSIGPINPGFEYQSWIDTTINTKDMGAHLAAKTSNPLLVPAFSARILYSENIPGNHYCTGLIPSNAVSYDSEESSDLTSNIPWTYSALDTATKCQYACNIGYAWTGSACKSQTTNSYTVLKKDSPITIDGNLNEFKNADPITITNSKGNSATYKMLWDENNLYISAQGNDDQLGAIIDTRDGSGMWADDSIELFFDTLNNKGSSLNSDDYKFIVNILGTQADSNVFNSLWNTEFNSKVKTTGTLNSAGDTDTGYTIEIAIPWTDLPTPSANDVWGFDVNMNDKRDDSTSIWKAWSQTSGLNKPDEFGEIVFSSQVYSLCGDADTNKDKAVDANELIAFIGRWKNNEVGIIIDDVINAIGFWKKGC